MDKYKKLASNTLIFAIGTFSSKILSFLLMPFVTRMMGTGDYGSADLVQCAYSCCYTSGQQCGIAFCS